MGSYSSLLSEDAVWVEGDVSINNNSAHHWHLHYDRSGVGSLRWSLDYDLDTPGNGERTRATTNTTCPESVEAGTWEVYAYTTGNTASDIAWTAWPSFAVTCITDRCTDVVNYSDMDCSCCQHPCWDRGVDGFGNDHTYVEREFGRNHCADGRYGCANHSVVSPECLTPGPTSSPNTSPTTGAPTYAAMLRVIDGPEHCQVTPAGNCVTDGAGNHDNNERCTVQVLAAGTLSSTSFEVEGFENCSHDRITINSTRYCGSTGPSNVPVESGSHFSWYSDHETVAEGWTVCLCEGATLIYTCAPMPPPTQQQTAPVTVSSTYKATTTADTTRPSLPTDAPTSLRPRWMIRHALPSSVMIPRCVRLPESGPCAWTFAPWRSRPTLPAQPTAARLTAWASVRSSVSSSPSWCSSFWG